jgi:hypothetical protein
MILYDHFSTYSLAQRLYGLTVFGTGNRKMRAQASNLTTDQRKAVAQWITGKMMNVECKSDLSPQLLHSTFIHYSLGSRLIKHPFHQLFIRRFFAVHQNADAVDAGCQPGCSQKTADQQSQR